MKRHEIQFPLAVIVLLGLTVFLYQLVGVIGKIDSWAVIWNPPTVSQMLSAVVAGCVAVLAACGVDVTVIGKSLLQLIGVQVAAPVPDPVVSVDPTNKGENV